MDGVKTRTFDEDVLLPVDDSFDVKRGRNACMVKMGFRRCVLKRSAKLDGGIVAMGEVW